MEWNKEERRAFREALISVYKTRIALKIFVSDAIDRNLDNISGELGLEDCAFELIDTAKTEWTETGEKLLCQLFQEFCRFNSHHPSVAQIQRNRLVEYSSQKISSQDWINLFSNFWEDDLLTIAKSCRGAFKHCFKRKLKEIYPDCPDLNTLDIVREVLEKYDDPELAVAFVNRTIELIQKLEEGDRDVSAIADWRDRVAQKYKVDPKIGIATQLVGGYLVVSIKRQARGIDLFAELHLTGDRSPEPLDDDLESERRGISCKFQGDRDAEISQILQEPLSKLIEKAEENLIYYQGSVPVTLEIFLPLEYLDKRVHEWALTDELNESCLLGEYRPFIVRSLDRAMNPRLSSKVKSNWACLQDCIQQNKIDFYCIDIKDSTCEQLSSRNVLIKKVGVKLAAGLPEDKDKRKLVLKTLVASSVPVSFWVHNIEYECCHTLQGFNDLLTAKNLKNFMNLATDIQEKRVRNNPIYHLGMLCDCPERMPTLPKQTQVPRARIP